MINTLEATAAEGQQRNVKPPIHAGGQSGSSPTLGIQQYKLIEGKMAFQRNKRLLCPAWEWPLWPAWTWTQLCKKEVPGKNNLCVF
jgi:hypothetical protein